MHLNVCNFFKGVSLGKFVPIDVIIDTLLANKNADIEKLKQQLDELQSLLDMYEKLDLTEDQKKQLGQMVSVLCSVENCSKKHFPETRNGKSKRWFRTVERHYSS